MPFMQALNLDWIIRGTNPVFGFILKRGVDETPEEETREADESETDRAQPIQGELF